MSNNAYRNVECLAWPAPLCNVIAHLSHDISCFVLAPVTEVSLDWATALDLSSRHDRAPVSVARI
jgi:hypothetical protein